MAKAPLKQLSVNTFESHRIASPKSSSKKSTSALADAQSVKKKKAVCKQLIPVEESHDDIPSIVQAGSRMATDEFESFVQKTAPDAYWHVMAEHYRVKLEEVTRENQQLHGVVDDLNKDNEGLRAIADHCEYLTDLIEKLTAEDDADGESSTRESVRVRLF